MTVKMKTENILIAFGAKVQALRKAQGLSQEQLAAIANLHRTYIGMIERGEKNATSLSIEKIAKALHVNISDLFDF